MATFDFQTVLVWTTNPGGVVRLLRNGAVTVYNAATDAVLFNLISDSQGLVSFTTTDVPTVYLKTTGWTSGHITAASAIEAAAAFTVSEDAAVANLVNDPGSSTRAGLNVTFAKKSPALVNVSDYGAVADDTTDNLTAFQAARDAVAPGGTIFVPSTSSRYYLSNTLDLSGKPVQIVGSGWNATIQPMFGGSFTTAGITGSVLRFGNTTGAGVYFGVSYKSGSVRDLAILGPGSGTSRGLQVGGASAIIRFRLERVLVANWYEGFWTYGMMNSTLKGLYALGNDRGITLTVASNGNSFVGTNVETSTTYGLRIDGCTANLFSGGVFQGGSGTTVSLVNASAANIFDTIYWENLLATWGADIASGCDYNQFRSCHFGYSSTHDQVRIAGGHNAVLWPQVAPQVTVTGASNFLIGLFANGTNTDTGANNVWIDTAGNFGVRFGARDVRVASGQKFVFETAGSNSYIMRETATGDTVIGSGSNVTRLSTNNSLAANVTTKTGNATVINEDVVVFNGSNVTATLPDPTTVRTGRIVRLKNVNATTLTVVSAGTSKTIDGAASMSLAQWSKAECVSDGTQWLTI